MPTNTLFAIAFPLLFALTGTATLQASQILASFEEHAFAGPAPCEGSEAQFFLEHDSQNFTHIVTLGKDLRFWQNGDSGIFDITPANSSSFANFSQLVTDGQDDFILSLGYVQGCGGGGPSYFESDMLGGNPDLSGSQLDFVRLIAHDIVVEPYIPPCDCGPGVRFDANITYEFWGTPIPEPAALLPLALAGLWATPRARRPRIIH